MSISNFLFPVTHGPVLDQIQKQNTIIDGSRAPVELPVSPLLPVSIVISVKDKPLALLMRSVFENINQYLDPHPEKKDQIQKAYDGAQGNTPEAVAQSMVDQLSRYYARFRQRYGDLSSSDLNALFLDRISSGIEQGFSETRSILDGLGGLDSGVSADITQAYNQLQKGLENLLEVT